jgi:hypothetical protein
MEKFGKHWFKTNKLKISENKSRATAILKAEQQRN